MNKKIISLWNIFFVATFVRDIEDNYYVADFIVANIKYKEDILHLIMEQIHHPFLWYPWLWEKLRKNEYAFRDIYHITIDEEFEHFLFIKNDNQHVNTFELGANCYDNAITIPNLIKRKENHIAHVLEVVMWEYIGDCSVCIYPFIWKDLELLIPMFLYHLIVKWKIKKKNYWVMIIRFLIALLKSKRKLNIKIREEKY